MRTAEELVAELHQRMEFRKKKRRRRRIIAAVIGAAVLLCGMVFAVSPLQKAED